MSGFRHRSLAFSFIEDAFRCRNAGSALPITPLLLPSEHKCCRHSETLRAFADALEVRFAAATKRPPGRKVSCRLVMPRPFVIQVANMLSHPQ